MNKKYIIAEYKTIGELEEEVNGLMEEGWKPLGGVCVTNITDNDGTTSWYAQAMIRETEPGTPEYIKRLTQDYVSSKEVFENEIMGKWVEPEK